MENWIYMNYSRYIIILDQDQLKLIFGNVIQNSVFPWVAHVSKVVLLT